MCYVRESSPKATIVEVSEVKVTVKIGSVARDCVYDDRSRAEFTTASDAAGKSIDK